MMSTFSKNQTERNFQNLTFDRVLQKHCFRVDGGQNAEIILIFRRWYGPRRHWFTDLFITNSFFTKIYKSIINISCRQQTNYTKAYFASDDET